MNTIKPLPNIDWDQQADYARQVREIRGHNQRVESNKVKGVKQQIPSPPPGWISQSQAERAIWTKLNEVITMINLLAKAMGSDAHT